MAVPSKDVKRSCMAAEHVAYGDAVAWRAVPEARRYLVRTFGCQMNEHDSERIAGLLEADGLTAADDARRRRRRRPQHLLHPRERRQQALRPPRPPQGREGPPARPPDRRRRLPGPEGPRPDRRAGAARRRRLRHPQRAPGRRRCSREAPSTDGPVVEILEETDPRRRRGVPVGAAGAPRARRGRRGSPSRSAATTPAPSASCRPVRGKEISRPFDDIVAEVAAAAADGVTEVTLLGQNVNCYGRDLTRRRPLFADLLRAVGAVDGIRRVRYTSPHPKDLRPETIEAMADDAGGVRAPAPAAAVRQRPRPRRHAPRLHRRALPRPAGRGPGAPSPTSPSPPTSSSASPARPTTTSSAPSRSSPRPPTTAPTRSSSAPGPAPRRPTWSTEFVAPEVVAERFERLRVVVERSALARHQARVGRVEEVLVEGPSKRDADVTTGRTRPEQARPLRAPTVACGRAPTPTCAVTGAAAAPPRAASSSPSPRRARHRTRIPVAAG